MRSFTRCNCTEWNMSHRWIWPLLSSMISDSGLFFLPLCPVSQLLAVLVVLAVLAVCVCECGVFTIGRPCYPSLLAFPSLLFTFQLNHLCPSFSSAFILPFNSHSESIERETKSDDWLDFNWRRETQWTHKVWLAVSSIICHLGANFSLTHLSCVSVFGQRLLEQAAGQVTSTSPSQYFRFFFIFPLPPSFPLSQGQVVQKVSPKKSLLSSLLMSSCFPSPFRSSQEETRYRADGINGHSFTSLNYTQPTNDFNEWILHSLTLTNSHKLTLTQSHKPYCLIDWTLRWIPLTKFNCCPCPCVFPSSRHWIFILTQTDKFATFISSSLPLFPFSLNSQSWVKLSWLLQLPKWSEGKIAFVTST